MRTHMLLALRRGRDSNPRSSCPDAAFRVRCLRPLSHPSMSIGAASRSQCSSTRLRLGSNVPRTFSPSQPPIYILLCSSLRDSLPADIVRNRSFTSARTKSIVFLLFSQPNEPPPRQMLYWLPWKILLFLVYFDCRNSKRKLSQGWVFARYATSSTTSQHDTNALATRPQSPLLQPVPKRYCTAQYESRRHDGRGRHAGR